MVVRAAVCAMTQAFLVVWNRQVGQAYHMEGARYVVVCFLPLANRCRALPQIIVCRKKGKSLCDQMMSTVGLTFEGVVEVGKSDREINHGITGVQCERTEEVVCMGFPSVVAPCAYIAVVRKDLLSAGTKLLPQYKM